MEKHQLALKQVSALWQACKSCIFLVWLFLFLDSPHDRLTEKQGVSHLFQQFFLNVADMKPRADLFPTQSCTAYNLQDEQAHISSHTLPLAQQLKNSHLKGKSKPTNPTMTKISGCAYSGRLLWDCRLLLTNLRAVTSCTSSTKACRCIVSKLNPDP